MYSDFMNAYYSALKQYFDNGVIDQVEIGLGPSGEMRYPAYPSNRWSFCGVGEFQVRWNTADFATARWTRMCAHDKLLVIVLIVVGGVSAVDHACV